MKIITIKTWSRPHYYERVLDSLYKCEGIEEYTIINSVDPLSYFTDQIVKLDTTHPINTKTNLITSVATKPQGCALNTKRVINMAFDMSNDIDFVIHLEDDTIVSADYLRYMEWCNKTFRNNKDIFVVVGYNFSQRNITSTEMNEQLPFVGCRIPKKTYLAWGIWRDRWDEVKHRWFGIHWNNHKQTFIPNGEEFLKYIRKSDDGSWGWPMLKYFRKTRMEVYPIISRCQNIGAKDGRFNLSPQWHRKHVYTTIFAQDVKQVPVYRTIGNE